MNPDYLEELSRASARRGHLFTVLSLLCLAFTVLAFSDDVKVMVAPLAIATGILFILGLVSYGKSIDESLEADRQRFEHRKDFRL